MKQIHISMHINAHIYMQKQMHTHNRPTNVQKEQDLYKVKSIALYYMIQTK